MAHSDSSIGYWRYSGVARSGVHFEAEVRRAVEEIFLVLRLLICRHLLGIL